MVLSLWSDYSVGYIPMAFLLAMWEGTAEPKPCTQETNDEVNSSSVKVKILWIVENHRIMPSVLLSIRPPAC